MAKYHWMAPLMVAAMVAAGCAKQPAPEQAAAAKPAPSTVQVVESGERSRHFAAVNQHLELGGTLYGYVDIDGDMTKVAQAIRQIVDTLPAEQPAAAALKLDYGQIFTDLGLNDVKAIGLSSVAVGPERFRNRAFFYTPDGRHGLLAAVGGPAAPFRNLALAPADTDLFAESEIDLAAVYAAVRGVVTRVAGEATANLVEAQLKQAGAEVGLSALDLVQRWKGRSTLILRFDGDKTLQLPTPKPVTIPAFSLVIRFDGIAPALTKALDGLPVFEKKADGAVTLYHLKAQLPLEGVAPVIAVDGEALLIATNPQFLADCRGAGPKLDGDAGFRQALGAVGQEGNGLTYVSPRLFARLRALPEMNAGADAETKRTLQVVVSQIPAADAPLVSLRTNLPDGVLIRSVWNQSIKQDIATLAVYNPVTIGVFAAMAVPAFEKVRGQSGENAIRNNLRQLSAAAEQFYLENGVETVSYDQLVGPGKYIESLKPVAGENYRSIIFKRGFPLRVRTREGKVVEYSE